MRLNGLKFCFILFTFFSISGCGQKELSENGNNNDKKRVTVTKSSKEKKKLKIMGHWFGEGKKELLIREAVREFSLLNQDLDITLEFPNQIFKDVKASQVYIATYDSIIKMVNTNTWPFDVIKGDYGTYSEVSKRTNNHYWGKTYLVDVSERDWMKNSHKVGILNSEFATMYGDIIPGPVLESITDILFVSEEVEKKLGITVKMLDMKASDLLEYAKVVSEYNKRNNDKITFFSNQYYLANDLIFQQMALSAYDRNEPGNKDEAVIAIEKAYRILDEIAEYKPIEQYIDYTGLSYDDASRKLFTDKCLFSMQPSWIYLLWSNMYPNEVKYMKPCEIPSYNQGNSKVYPGFHQSVFAICKNAANPEGAERFLKFIASKDIADKMVKYSKCPTGLKNSISFTDFGLDKFDVFFRHVQKKYNNNLKQVNLSKYLFNTDKTIDFKVKELLSGSISADEALKNVIAQIK